MKGVKKKKKKAFFLESTYPPQAGRQCDKCGLIISEVQDGKCFWNPNPKAIDRNICRNCFDVFQYERQQKWALWQEKHAALLRETTEQKGDEE